jgi:threonyl-tRNA synthetase
MAIKDRPVTNADYPALKKISDLAIKDKQKFERLVVPKKTLLEMFSVRIYVISLTLKPQLGVVV